MADREDKERVVSDEPHPDDEALFALLRTHDPLISPPPALDQAILEAARAARPRAAWRRFLFGPLGGLAFAGTVAMGLFAITAREMSPSPKATSDGFFAPVEAPAKSPAATPTADPQPAVAQAAAPEEKPVEALGRDDDRFERAQKMPSTRQPARQAPPRKEAGEKDGQKTLEDAVVGRRARALDEARLNEKASEAPGARGEFEQGAARPDAPPTGAATPSDPSANKVLSKDAPADGRVIGGVAGLESAREAESADRLADKKTQRSADEGRAGKREAATEVAPAQPPPPPAAPPVVQAPSAPKPEPAPSKPAPPRAMEPSSAAGPAHADAAPKAEAKNDAEKRMGGKGAVAGGAASAESQAKELDPTVLRRRALLVERSRTVGTPRYAQVTLALANLELGAKQYRAAEAYAKEVAGSTDPQIRADAARILSAVALALAPVREDAKKAKAADVPAAETAR